MRNVLSTQNPAWGFFGTIRHHAEAEQAWALAMPAVAAATGCCEEAVRDFLDSRHGRHFADDVANGLFAGLALEAAIDVAVTRWMGWRIGRRTSAQAGIPADLPYLTGFVIACEIEAEAQLADERDRGRDVDYSTPPAQIRTGGFPAYGSHLGCLTAKRADGQG